MALAIKQICFDAPRGPLGAPPGGANNHNRGREFNQKNNSSAVEEKPRLFSQTCAKI